MPIAGTAVPRDEQQFLTIWRPPVSQSLAPTATKPVDPSPADSTTPRWRARWAVPWRSPKDQPAWARPVLLAVAAASAVLYGWGLNNHGLHPYYAPAVKSMSVSWKAFFYGG